MTLTAQVSPCMVALPTWQAGPERVRRWGRAGARGGAPVVFGDHRARVSNGAALLERAAYDAHGTSVAFRGCTTVLAGWGPTRSAMGARRRSRRRSRRVRRSPSSGRRRRCDARACALRRSQHQCRLAWLRHRFGRLGGNKIGDAGAQALATALETCPWIATLEYAQERNGSLAAPW